MDSFSYCICLGRRVQRPRDPCFCGSNGVVRDALRHVEYNTALSCCVPWKQAELIAVEFQLWGASCSRSIQDLLSCSQCERPARGC
eukprot:3263784-Amphidinium_carterae.1